MCEANEDDKDVYPPRVGKPSMGTVCMKCKERRASMLIRVNDPFCRECFREYFVHKFRAVLGKRKITVPGEKVLVAVSGGASSCALLAQVQLGLSRETHKRLRFVPGLVHVDEGAACGETVEQRVSANARIEEIFKRSGFPYHFVPLEQALRLGSNGEHSATESGRQRSDQRPDQGVAEQGVGEQGVGATAEETEALCSLFRAARTLTAKEDLLFSLRLRVLEWLCRRRGYEKVMLGESCTRVAVRILAGLALGRGAGLALDTGLCDDRFGGVVFVRPMRELSAKEVALYVHAFRVDTAWRPSLTTLAGDQASITSLTEAFVTELQAEFPSTVSTIYRTGEKVGLAASSRAAGKCALCASFLDTDEVPASALQAALVSEKLSGQRHEDPPAPCNGPAQCCSDRGACCRDDGANHYVNRQSLSQALCYGCRLTVSDVDEVKALPPFVLSEVEKREKRRLVKAQIQEFLLDDDGDDDDGDDDDGGKAQ